MTAYAIGRLWNVTVGAEIESYLAQIDDTLTPFGGQFIIHGGPRIVLEGEWSEDLIVIAFPDLAHARAWYGSPAYQRIVALRTRNSRGDVILMDGVGPDHRALDVLKGTASR
ncbi:DUF1330 domain-containing protein [Paraburkholderia phenoliruptrix]|uniref:DUF1330 domain-containing protein n=1 Tax=Paraburkholderia phenoliruptrix TaxID=252970 RepID=A0ABV3W5H8_9BURK|nr:DUF1330 domain-containing protein [Paraburkholderia phenoliruptrix]MDR6390408.1 uncharacterized protein (DUF1330 family) [Paraburkholderia phenoliruptrix]WMY12687.1 DUF1330 domain-containing protein [Paraburkholderia phenoliruptrix]